MLSAAVALAVAAPAVANGPHTPPGSQSDSVTHTCNPQGDTISLAGPTLLWPPNHKLVPIGLSMDDAQGGDSTFGTVTTHDETLDGTEMNGSGNTAEDAVEVEAATGDPAEAEIKIRAERSGQGNGRVYTIEVSGTAGTDACSTTFEVLVPHDMRPSNRVKPDNEQPES